MNGTGRLAIQGVDYSASISGFLSGGSSSGATTMASLINSTLSACPDTRLTLSGYSQGAQLVHLAAASLPASTTSKIASVVLFGDPKNGSAIAGVDASKVLTVCHAGDNICMGGDKIGIAHLNYSGTYLYLFFLHYDFVK
jgi:cutinase